MSCSFAYSATSWILYFSALHKVKCNKKHSKYFLGIFSYWTFLPADATSLWVYEVRDGEEHLLLQEDGEDALPLPVPHDLPLQGIEWFRKGCDNLNQGFQWSRFGPVSQSQNCDRFQNPEHGIKDHLQFICFWSVLTGLDRSFEWPMPKIWPGRLTMETLCPTSLSFQIEQLYFLILTA